MDCLIRVIAMSQSGEMLNRKRQTTSGVMVFYPLAFLIIIVMLWPDHAWVVDAIYPKAHTQRMPGKGCRSGNAGYVVPSASGRICTRVGIKRLTIIMNLMIIYLGIIQMMVCVIQIIAASLTTRVGTLLFSSLMIRFQPPRINLRGALPVLTLSVL